MKTSGLKEVCKSLRRTEYYTNIRRLLKQEDELAIRLAEIEDEQIALVIEIKQIQSQLAAFSYDVEKSVVIALAKVDYERTHIQQAPQSPVRLPKVDDSFPLSESKDQDDPIF